MDSTDSSFSVKFSYKGKLATVSTITRRTTSRELLRSARSTLNVGDDVLLKLLYKGKIIGREDDAAEGGRDDGLDAVAFPAVTVIPKGGTAKVVVMGSETRGVLALNAGRSDPLTRGFDDERTAATKKRSAALSSYWGPGRGNQHLEHKFCRIQECTDASFGTRPGATTPHAFEARRLLERLATDPGIVAIMTSRELVVGTLGEMDPVDDRLMQKKQKEGGCLLGYNTNHGTRIDVKLRTDDLAGFRPYPELASTLVHELSHNWVGEHNALFWTNFGQMRVEYMYTHTRPIRMGGKTTASLAGVEPMFIPRGGSGFGSAGVEGTRVAIAAPVLTECAKEMAQHGVPVQAVAPAILSFANDLAVEAAADEDARGRRLGGSSAGDGSARERALTAAEERAKESSEKKSQT